MDPRALARLMAVGRIAYGLGLIAAPGTLGTAWVGSDGARPGTRVIARGFGGRDLAIGAGTALAVAQGFGARPWLQAAALSDLTDLVATLRERHDLPLLSVIGVGALAGGATMLDVWLQTKLD